MSEAVLGQVLAVLRERTQQQIDSDPLICGIAAFLGRGPCSPPPPEVPAVWSYQDVARHAVAAAPGDPTAFNQGLEWLTGCRFFRKGEPAGFEGDPLSIFAVAIGVHRGGEEEARDWLLALTGQAMEGERDSWRLALLGGTRALLGASASWEDLPAEVAVALEAAGLVEAGDSLLERAFRDALGSPQDGERAVFQLVAVEHVLRQAGRIDLHRPTVADVVAMLRRVPAALKRWPWEEKAKSRKAGVTPQKWDLQFEDHVQALLYAILRPVLTDIDDEEYLKSLGHKQPRADFVVPSLRLVIEVKFLRDATQSARAKVIEEVSADTGLYLNDETPYDRMVAFLWDDTSSVQHHDELVAGLTRLPGVVDAVVVSRPGSWERKPT